MIDNKALATDAFKMGAIFGLIQIVITMLLYVMGVETMVSYASSAIVLISILGCLIYGGIKWRKSNNNVALYGKMFLFIWICSIALFTVSTIFNILLYNVIDPDLAANMTEAIIENTMSMMEGFGVPDEALDQTMAELEKVGDKFKPGAQIQSMFMTYIGLAVLAAILALFLKKEEKVFDDIEEA